MHPKPGEMVLGERFCKFFGGKGANQAVTASRLGANVAIIGKVFFIFQTLYQLKI